MIQLPRAEEQVMEYIWQQEKVFFKDLVDCFPEPRPASSTVATLLKRLQDKDFVSYKMYGNSREYFPLVTKEAYFSNHFKGIIKNFFNNSALRFASFFTQSNNLSTKELEQLRGLIDQEIKKKKK
jgi:BlaI family penicillinase repressor